MLFDIYLYFTCVYLGRPQGCEEVAVFDYRGNYSGVHIVGNGEPAKTAVRAACMGFSQEDVARGIQDLLDELRKVLGEGAQGSDVEALFEGKKSALIVGVNNTRRSSLLPDLKYAEDDAHEIAYILRTPACNFIIEIIYPSYM
jgi:hypothetical protein